MCMYICKNIFVCLLAELPFPQVTRLCDLSVEGDSVTSVGWSERVSTHSLLPSGNCQGALLVQLVFVNERILHV